MSTVQAYVTKSDSDFVSVEILDAKTKEQFIGIGFTNDIDLNEYKSITQTDDESYNINHLRNIQVLIPMAKSVALPRI